MYLPNIYIYINARSLYFDYNLSRISVKFLGLMPISRDTTETYVCHKSSAKLYVFCEMRSCQNQN